mgnify:CR=1 FL=1
MSYIERRQRHIKVIEFTDKEKGLEYYKNADGRLVSQLIDETIGYRAAELAPEVTEALDRARAMHNYPSRPMIDNLVHMQEASVEKAVTYVKYRLLGEATYLDVFGRDAEDRRAAQQHYKKQDEMQMQIAAMAAQMADMQKLIFNMAAQMNRENNSGYKRAI